MFVLQSFILAKIMKYAFNKCMSIQKHGCILNHKYQMLQVKYQDITWKLKNDIFLQSVSVQHNRL